MYHYYVSLSFHLSFIQQLCNTGLFSYVFSDPIDQDIRTQWALSWKIVVSEWQSVIAVSLNVGDGVRLIRPAKLCMCMQNTTNTTRTDARCRVCARRNNINKFKQNPSQVWENKCWKNIFWRPSISLLCITIISPFLYTTIVQHRSIQLCFFRSNRPGYSLPVSSELEKSGIRVAVGDCSVTECRRWCPSYQTGKTVHVHAKHYKHNEDRRTMAGVCGNGSVPLSHSGNVVTRIGIHTLYSIKSYGAYQCWVN